MPDPTLNLSGVRAQLDLARREVAEAAARPRELLREEIRAHWPTDGPATPARPVATAVRLSAPADPDRALLQQEVRRCWPA